jgi:hypothetical protein
LLNTIDLKKNFRLRNKLPVSLLKSREILRLSIAREEKESF